MVLSSTSDNVLNFRKLRHDFSGSCLRDGKALFEKSALIEAKLTGWSEDVIVLNAKVRGQFNDIHTCQLELMRIESDIAYSSCDCSHGVDCQHIACLLFYLEQHFPELLVAYLRECDEKKRKSPSSTLKKADVEKNGSRKELHSEGAVTNTIKKKASEEKSSASSASEAPDDSLRVGEALPQGDLLMKEAERKSWEKVREKQEKQLLEEYAQAGLWLSKSSLATAACEELKPVEQAELYIAIGNIAAISQKQPVEFHLAVRIPGKAKPVLIQQPRLFLHALYMEEPIVLGTARTLLTDASFGAEPSAALISILRERSECIERHDKEGKLVKTTALPYEAFVQWMSMFLSLKQSHPDLPLFVIDDALDNVYQLSTSPILPQFSVQLIKDPHKQLHIEVSFSLPHGIKRMREVKIFHAKRPFLVSDGHFFLLESCFGAKQSTDLEAIENLSIPESLFATFVTYSLPSLEKFGTVSLSKEAQDVLQGISCALATPQPHIHVHMQENEDLSLEIFFSYGGFPLVPEIQRDHTSLEQGKEFVQSPEVEERTENMCLARNFSQERMISQEITWGMVYDEKRGIYTARAEKKVQEFFAEVVAARLKTANWIFDDRIKNLYATEESVLTIHIRLLQEGGGASSGKKCSLQLEISGPLEDVPLDKVLDAAKNRRMSIDTGKPINYSGNSFGLKTKQLLMDMEAISDLAELAHDLAIPSLANGVEWDVPLWVVFGLDETSYPHIRLNIDKDPNVVDVINSLSQCNDTSSDKSKKRAAAKDEKGGVESAGGRYELRSYQRDGVVWIQKLREYGLSGILADDMGLGKTLQTIVALSKVYGCSLASASSAEQEDAPPSLIICPTSLVENWKEEIAKYEPNLKALLFFGSPQERKRLVQEIHNVHVVITSYGVLQKEIELLETIPMMYVILDEAQTIKNRETRNARSVKRLNALHRLVLTGTPVENSLEDLWSLFDFLMPGFLGSFERFSTNYIRQLSKDPERVVQKLKKRIQPFVLRRMKKDVLDDLPPISYRTYYAYLKDEEKRLYDAYAKQAKAELEEVVSKEGFDKARLHVLATISKLKQICCHPQLVADNTWMQTALASIGKGKGDSYSDQEVACAGSKYELLIEIVDNLVASGRKTVIFSQYTKMLSIMKEDLEEKQIQHLYLDGSTKNRLQLVKQFNEDPSTHVFLISLKAGGTGLNLVGADTVIHYDLWWNPAVENQATDRVWRMGQKTKVSSYKLVVKGTIEEKIAELQEKKRDLIVDIVQSDEDTLSLLNYDDVMALFQDV